MAFLHEDKEKFRFVVRGISVNRGLDEDVVEKDYYVTLLLRGLKERLPFVVFKGGTSLSKCHKVIDRFSEDIDIAIDASLSQGQKKKLKYVLIEVAEKLGLSIMNLDDIRSRRDYNRYEMAYETVGSVQPAVVKPTILLETSFTAVSFPTVMLKVDSYVGEFLKEEMPDSLCGYHLDTFEMKVQGIDRTLADKVFAICDYYLQNRVRKHSRHIYDVYKLMPLVPMDEDFKKLVSEVREVRKQSSICPSAQNGVDVPELLLEIIGKEIYREDYEYLTERLLGEKVKYDTAIKALQKMGENGMFENMQTG